MRPLLVLALAFLAASCRYPNADERFGLVHDDDDDGFTSDVDCDDDDPDVNPDADEVCNGIDDDCDDEIDVDPIDPSTFWVDADGDTFGDNSLPTVQGCTAPQGYAPEGGDCADDDKDFNPDATDLADDDLDQDCSGSDTVTCFKDFDGDGFGDPDEPKVFATDGSCDVEQGESDNDDDCLDTNANARPGGTEVPGDGIDQDCSGADAPPCWVDADGDDFGDLAHPLVVEACDGDNQATNHDDCDDDDETVYPDATELCDGQLNDCDGAMLATEDNEDDDAYVACALDAGGWDGDGNVTGGNDCDDTDDTVFPTAPELCDGQLNACGGAMLATEDNEDGDAFVECALDAGGWDGPGTVTGGDDCDDTDDLRFPGATERCNGLDDSCDGNLSDLEDDDDDDGYVECEPVDWDPSGEEPEPGDCNDANAQIYPSAPELCDGLDNDCDPDDSILDEAGKVSYQPPTGAWVDVTATYTPAAGNLNEYVVPDAGGTVWFCDSTGLSDGAYHATTSVPVTLTGPLTLRGRNGAANTVLSGAKAGETAPFGRVVVVNASTLVTIRDLTLERGYTATTGGAVRFASTTSNGHIEDCVIRDSEAQNGGGVQIANGTLVIVDTTIAGNTAGRGGGLHVGNGTVDVSGTISGNHATTNGQEERGGGIYVVTGDVDLSNAFVEDNDSDSHGGGVYVLAGSVDLSTSTLDGNTAGGHGGGMYVTAGTITGTGLDVVGNTSTRGGGIYAAGGTLTFDDLLVDDNEATENRGGGGIALADAVLDVEVCTFTGNVASHTDADGGAVLFDDNTGIPTADFLDCTFGGADVDANTAPDKGGAFACRQECEITVTDSIVSHNVSEWAGAVDLNAALSSFSCVDTVDGFVGAVKRNRATGDPSDSANFAGGAHLGGANATTLVFSDGCDWGTGADDNVVLPISGEVVEPTLADIGSTAYRTSAYGADANFTCTALTCVSAGSP